MCPSPTSAGPTAAKRQSRRPLWLGRSQATKREKAPASGTARRGPSPEVGPPHAYIAMSDLGDLMEEPAGGPNHGRRAYSSPELVEGRVNGRPLDLGTHEGQASELVRSGGYSVADVARGSGGATPGARDAGMSAHRGVLQEGEHVDRAAVETLVERELGFTLTQLHSVYSTGGRLPSTLMGLRDQIDARMLALSGAGANMDLFGRVTRLNASTLDRALARARAKEELA